TWGIGWAFNINAISFFAVVIAWWFVRVPAMPEVTEVESFGARLKGGFDYSRRNTNVGRLLLLTAVGAFCVMHAPLMPAIVKDVLHRDTSTYALLSSAPGVGAFVGALLAGEITSGPARRRTMGACTIGMALALLLLSFSRIVWLSAACLIAFGLGYFLLNALVTTVVVLSSTDEYRGRVMGFLSMANAGIVPVNAIAAGVLASFIGPATTVGLAATTLLIFSIWFVAAGKLSLVVGAGSEGGLEQVGEHLALPEVEAGLDVLGLPSAMGMLDDETTPVT
ncbi:MAG TPA: MFS transporter, partial [Acidimicrobiia bacterium]|nr:MFS transporter [Acidimicrobiia bacterium]